MRADATREFEAFVRSRGAALERYAYVLSGEPRLAEDLVQTALLKAYRHWTRVAAAEQPDAYVRRMITTTFLDERRRRSSGESPVADVPQLRSVPDVATGVVERDEFRRALAFLTRQQRAVLVLRHMEGLSDEAIADVLRCSVSTVRTHASRGRDRFAAGLGLGAPASTSPGETS